MLLKSWTQLAILLIASANLLPQSTQNPTITQLSTPTVIDVVAVDKKGNTLARLQPEDIQITLDGTRLPAEFKDTPQKKEPSAYEAAPEIFRKPPAGSYSNLTAVIQQPTDARIIVLADVFNTPPAQRGNLRNAITHLLSHIGPDSHITIYALAERLWTLQDASGDPKALLAAIEKAKDHSETGSVVAVPASVNLNITQFLHTVEDFETFQTVPSQDDQNTITLSALDSIARQFENVPGRKALLWITEAPPCVFSDAIFRKSRQCDTYQPLLMSTLQKIQQAHIAIYPITPHAQEKHEAQQASTFGFERTPSGTPIYSSTHSAMGEAFKQELIQKTSAINTIVKTTGGRSLEMNQLERAVEITRQDCKTYMQLTIPIQHGVDSGHHKLEISTTRHNVSLLFPHEYFQSKSSITSAKAQPSQDELEEALTSDRSQSTGILLLARKRENEAQIEITVDTKSLSFHPEKDGNYSVGFDLGVATFSPTFKVIAANQETMRSLLDSAKMEQALNAGTLSMHFGYPVDQRVRFVRVLIRNSDTGKMGTVDVPIECASCNLLQ